jgi:hypothetical protein
MKWLTFILLFTMSAFALGEPTGVSLVLTTDGAAVRLTGPLWSWDPDGGPEASDNGDGTWTVTFDPAPTLNMKYLWVVDGTQENLIDNARNDECSAEIDAGYPTLLTDYVHYANRVFVGSSPLNRRSRGIGPRKYVADTYDACAGTLSCEAREQEWLAVCACSTWRAECVAKKISWTNAGCASQICG